MNKSKLAIFLMGLLIVSFSGFAAAKTVYMEDGSEIEAQSAWKEGDKVFLRINPDLCLEFPTSEVDVVKSGIAKAPSERSANFVRKGMSSTTERSGDVIDELIRVSGQRRDFNDLFGRGGRGEVEQIFADSYSPEQAEKTYRRCLERRLSKQELAKVLAWYKSPLGAKIVEADSVWDLNGAEKVLTYVGRESVPGFKERMSLITQIEQSTGITEIETRLSQNLMNKMIEDVPPNFPDGYEIKAILRRNIPTLESSRKRAIQQWAYNYRDIPPNELGDYLKFLRSAAGQKYMGAVREAVEEIFGKVAMNIEKEFSKYVK